MRSRIACLALGLILALFTAPAFAQEGGGFLRGYVRDESGAVLPGVSVTATSAELLQPSVAVTDEAGLYRLNNLPPGTYVHSRGTDRVQHSPPRRHPRPRRRRRSPSTSRWG